MHAHIYFQKDIAYLLPNSYEYILFSQPLEFPYEKNGNMAKGLNKNISTIAYNFLNLPNKVRFAGGKSIEYEYGTDDSKLLTVHKRGGVSVTTVYCGNVV